MLPPTVLFLPCSHLCPKLASSTLRIGAVLALVDGVELVESWGYTQTCRCYEVSMTVSFRLSAARRWNLFSDMYFLQDIPDGKSGLPISFCLIFASQPFEVLILIDVPLVDPFEGIPFFSLLFARRNLRDGRWLLRIAGWSVSSLEREGRAGGGGELTIE